MCFIKDELDHFDEKFAKSCTDFLVKKVRPKKTDPTGARSTTQLVTGFPFLFESWVATPPITAICGVVVRQGITVGVIITTPFEDIFG
jgi:hypothetical protein